MPRHFLDGQRVVIKGWCKIYTLYKVFLIECMLCCTDEVYLACVFSTKAHAKIISVDWTKALTMKGVLDKVDHTDVPGSNLTGHIIKDEVVFATDTVSKHTKKLHKNKTISIQ